MTFERARDPMSEIETCLVILTAATSVGFAFVVHLLGQILNAIQQQKGSTDVR